MVGRKRNIIDLPSPPKPDSVLLDPINWPRAYLVMTYMANTGASVRYEISEKFSDHFGMTAASAGFKRLFVDMVRAGLIISELTRLVVTSELTLIRLSPLGQQLMRDLGESPVVSDWEICLNRKITGQEAAMTLEFMYQARARGWVPEIPEKRDVLTEHVIIRKTIDHGGLPVSWPVYIFSEARPRINGRLPDDRPVAVCATIQSRRMKLVSQMKNAHIPGASADLLSLILSLRKGLRSELWAEFWTF